MTETLVALIHLPAHPALYPSLHPAFKVRRGEWFQHSFEEGAKPVVLHPQMLADFNTVNELGHKMLDELKRYPERQCRVRYVPRSSGRLDTDWHWHCLTLTDRAAWH
jgi:hypothetical protein